MKVKEMNIEGTRIEIHDDYIVPEKEKQEILNRANRIISSALLRQRRTEKSISD